MSLIESSRTTQNNPMNEKGIKEQRIKSMETTGQKEPKLYFYFQKCDTPVNGTSSIENSCERKKSPRKLFVEERVQGSTNPLIC